MSAGEPQKLYPELPWTDEDEAAADRAMGYLEASGALGRLGSVTNERGEDADAQDARVRREIAEAEQLKQQEEPTA